MFRDFGFIIALIIITSVLSTNYIDRQMKKHKSDEHKDKCTEKIEVKNEKGRKIRH